MGDLGGPLWSSPAAKADTSVASPYAPMASSIGPTLDAREEAVMDGSLFKAKLASSERRAKCGPVVVWTFCVSHDVVFQPSPFSTLVCRATRPKATHLIIPTPTHNGNPPGRLSARQAS